MKLTVGGTAIRDGSRKQLELRVARLATGTWLSLPVTVVNGRGDGPVVWISGVIHGDELNGIEIVRQVIAQLDARTLRGAVIAVPVVNVHGFINGSRYLPDRRDLNRSFPGSARGSLTARLANLFMKEVVSHSDYGIDLHTGSDDRDNYPQIRADLDDEETHRLACAFGTRLVVHSRIRDGSLRQAAVERGIRVLVYEGGEALRFNHHAIDAGTTGVMRVLHALGMVATPVKGPASSSLEIRRSAWVRARRSGLLRLDVEPGQEVEDGQQLGSVADVAGSRASAVVARRTGWILGMSRSPLVNRGDALVHIGERR